MTHASVPSIDPVFRYREARAAIEWLCRAVGFAQHVAFDAESFVWNVSTYRPTR